MCKKQHKDKDVNMKSNFKREEEKNMSIILLDQDTINKIAAGEVIERPMAVV